MNPTQPPSVVALVIIGVFAAWLNSGRLQAALENQGWYYESWLLKVGNPSFYILMDRVFGILCLAGAMASLLLGFGEASLVLSAWSLGWWVGELLVPKLRAEQREEMRRYFKDLWK